MAAEPVSVVVAAKALDGLTMRMAAISQNLANAGSPRFQAVKVDFENSLRIASRHGPDAVRSLDFTFTADRVFLPGEDRRLDLQLADAAQTAMRYAALVDMLGRRLSIQRALAGGK